MNDNQNTLPPLTTSFPNSEKVHKDADPDLFVPERAITLANGEVVRTYDTTGPQGHDVRAGLPKGRAEWIAKRRARGRSSAPSFTRAKTPDTKRFSAARRVFRL